MSDRDPSDHLDRVREALAKGAGEPDPAVRLGFLEEAIRIADAHNDAELGFELRDEMVHDAIFAGFPDKAIVAFAWCLARSDREPERFPEAELLWKYKWVAPPMSEYPDIPADRIEAMLEDMAARYRRNGANLRAVHKIRCVAALQMGRAEEAGGHFEAWRKTRADWSSDCDACDADDATRYLAAIGDDEGAMKAAKPLLSGRMSCAEVPHLTLGRVLRPLLRLGRGAEAMAEHKRGYPMVRRNREMLSTIAEHVEFLVLVGRAEDAKRMFERHLPWTSANPSALRTLRTLRAGLLAVEALVAERGTSAAVRFKFPADDPDRRESGRFALGELRDALRARAEALAARFDRRNGNGHHSALVGAGIEADLRAIRPL